MWQLPAPAQPYPSPFRADDAADAGTGADAYWL
jgi:hypothetical protein